MSVIPELGRQRHEDHCNLEVALVYIVDPDQPGLHRKRVNK